MNAFQNMPNKGQMKMHRPYKGSPAYKTNLRVKAEAEAIRLI